MSNFDKVYKKNTTSSIVPNIYANKMHYVVDWMKQFGIVNGIRIFYELRSKLNKFDLGETKYDT